MTRAHVFDMDGVLLASNGLKDEAFRRAAEPYGEQAAVEMVALHQRAGSISRRERVERFFADVLGLPDVAEVEVERFLDAVAHDLANGYQTAEFVPGVVEYIESVDGPRYVVSGVEQGELERILEARGLAGYFDGIYGGNKHQLLPGLVADGAIPLPATYYGDTYDDAVAADRAGLQFVLVYGESSWADWADYCGLRPWIQAIPDFSALVSAGGAAERPVTRVRVGRDGYAMVAGERRYMGRSLAGAVVTL